MTEFFNGRLFPELILAEEKASALFNYSKLVSIIGFSFKTKYPSLVEEINSYLFKLIPESWIDKMKTGESFMDTDSIISEGIVLRPRFVEINNERLICVGFSRKETSLNLAEFSFMENWHIPAIVLEESNLCYINKRFIAFARKENLKTESIDEILNSFLNETDQTIGLEDLEKLQKGGELYLKKQRANKTFRWFRLQMGKLGEKHTFLSIEDVHRHVKLEEENKELREAAFDQEEQNKSFVKNIAHELRTPLNAILGFAQLLEIEDSQARKKKDYVGVIRNRSKTLLRLIDDISDLTKIDSGQLSLNPMGVNVERLLKDVQVLFEAEKQQMGKRHIEIQMGELPMSSNIYYKFDPGRVEQVLTSLVSNALKFTDEGFVRLSYKNLGNGKLQFVVEDSGIGIPAGKLPTLFERFASMESSMGSNTITSGLGLAVAKGVTECLGGKIWCESEISRGTRFYFQVPADQIESDMIDAGLEKELKSKQNYDWKDKLVLVVEDEETNVMLYEEMLEDMKVRVIHARDGKQAIDLVEKLPDINVVLMDLKMPNMDGYQATHEIKRRRKDLPIIIQTAYAFEDEGSRLEQLGCDDFISKPIGMDELYQKLDKFLG